MLEPHIIAENEWLIAIDKPAGLIVHRDGRTDEPSLADWIGENFSALRGVGGAWVSPQGESVPLNGLVHRLDRTTSGVVLAAKNQDVFEYLKSEFKERRVEKKYQAWVYVSPKPAQGLMPGAKRLGSEFLEEEGTIVAEIMRSSEKPRRWYARACGADDPRAAITHWRVLERRAGATLLEIIPKTGRTHQIRVHLASIGHPIVADHLYSPDRTSIFGFNRPALHAVSIAVTLPSGERVEYSAPLPSDFLHLVN